MMDVPHPGAAHASLVREFMKQSLTMTVVGNGMVAVCWAALFASLSLLFDTAYPPNFGWTLISLVMLRIMPPYLLAAIAYGSVTRADRYAASALVLAPLSGLAASTIGFSISTAIPLVELPLHLLTTITGVMTARKLLSSTDDELRQDLASRS